EASRPLHQVVQQHQFALAAGGGEGRPGFLVAIGARGVQNGSGSSAHSTTSRKVLPQLCVNDEMSSCQNTLSSSTRTSLGSLVTSPTRVYSAPPGRCRRQSRSSSIGISMSAEPMNSPNRKASLRGS